MYINLRINLFSFTKKSNNKTWDFDWFRIKIMTKSGHQYNTKPSTMGVCYFFRCYLRSDKNNLWLSLERSFILLDLFSDNCLAALNMWYWDEHVFYFLLMGLTVQLVSFFIYYNIWFVNILLRIFCIYVYFIMSLLGLGIKGMTVIKYLKSVSSFSFLWKRWRHIISSLNVL